ncbi:MAG: transcriptional regulator [Actinobacteria bacterium HGW-Actinobacteria-7]|nr:MAG: transcriptional regulator [Actinobacteria bacterium HGW-Actinobacteria-7]
MKKIEAVIRPEKLDDVKAALEKAGYPGLMLTRIEGHGQQKGIMQQFRGRGYKVELLAKFRVEVVCSDGECGRLIAAISEAARTGEVGDGKIFVSDISDVIRIRTGESGETAV